MKHICTATVMVDQTFAVEAAAIGAAAAAGAAVIVTAYINVDIVFVFQMATQ